MFKYHPTAVLVDLSFERYLLSPGKPPAKKNLFFLPFPILRLTYLSKIESYTKIVTSEYGKVKYVGSPPPAPEAEIPLPSCEAADLPFTPFLPTDPVMMLYLQSLLTSMSRQASIQAPLYLEVLVLKVVAVGSKLLADIELAPVKCPINKCPTEPHFPHVKNAFPPWPKAPGKQVYISNLNVHFIPQSHSISKVTARFQLPVSPPFPPFPPINPSLPHPAENQIGR